MIVFSAESFNKVSLYSSRALYLEVINVLLLLSSYRWPFSLRVIYGFTLLIKALFYCFKVSRHLDPYLKSSLVSLSLLPVSDGILPISE